MNKEEYEQDLELKLKEWDSKIDQLKAKADGMEASAREKAFQEIQRLQEKRKDIDAKVKELKAAGEGAWQGVKDKISGTLSDFSDRVNEAANKVRG